MILYSLQIVVKEKTKNIASSDFRRLILTLTDGFPNEIKLKINFHINDEAFQTKNPRKIPYLLFAKPFENSFQIFAYGDIGAEILEKITIAYPRFVMHPYLKNKKPFIILVKLLIQLFVVSINYQQDYIIKLMH